MAFTATLGFEEGCTILSYDGANAFHSIYRHRFLPALAEIVPSVVPYASNLYKLVRTGTPKTPVCTRWWRFGSGCVSAGNTSRMQSRFTLLQRRLTEDPKNNSGLIHRCQERERFRSSTTSIHGHSATGTFSRYGRDRESYGMAAGTPGGRMHLAELKKIAGPASRWSWARTTGGRAARGNGYHRAHGGPTGDEGCGRISWNRTVPAQFLTGGG